MQGVILSGWFEVHCEGECVRISNGITQQGLNHALLKHFNPSLQAQTWYAGLIDDVGFTGISDSDTHASHSGWSELTSLASADRARIRMATPTSKVAIHSPLAVGENAIDLLPLVPGSSHPAAVKIRGVFMANIATVGSTSSGGVLWSTGLFDAPRTYQAGARLTIVYGCTASERST